MKTKISDFAIAGGRPIFDVALPVGQLYFPEWSDYAAEMRGIFDRGYYTNHGPLIEQFESELSAYLGVKHAICVTNATIGLMLAAVALELEGKVIMPSFTFVATGQSLLWNGLTPVFCDSNPVDGQMQIEHLESLIDEDTSAILGVNLWGGVADIQAMEQLAIKYGLHLYFDSAHGFGSRIAGRTLGANGELEVFSFHATKVMSTAEGGCITTNDDFVAARVRSMRSSYGIGTQVKVPVTCNGRFSEAQAAIGLLNLKALPVYISHNKKIYDRYRERISSIPGLRIIEASGVDFSNCQYFVCDVDADVFGLDRDTLIALLKLENINARRYFYPGTHRVVSFADEFSRSGRSLPGVDLLSRRIFQLPIGAKVSLEMVDKISELLHAIHVHAEGLKARF
ncbi:aminotransferase class I/II-fold pyridoxal phosphate-dependent enzyme [Aquitalea sp. LB_tupeE]|uniref:aminotransferase class I/II-fold pyridoxal phosphate-dependent enzyme n=1 Tax=Aquitalea sp. LB_tupeE TaxID=2748078 RepID=UPI0015BEF370|nr:aminotransferase class I/II-fold pyridoxal phosphate-dependent enzyme [Aquitalea sp. LB_tupeE]NWK77244.1 aminotransferase class I/II-fold pyridoxal phosphate-dependent enzyme [Aquitalea sp. LB_tupeE]